MQLCIRANPPAVLYPALHPHWHIRTCIRTGQSTVSCNMHQGWARLPPEIWTQIIQLLQPKEDDFRKPDSARLIQQLQLPQHLAQVVLSEFEHSTASDICKFQALQQVRFGPDYVCQQPVLHLCCVAIKSSAHRHERMPCKRRYANK